VTVGSRFDAGNRIAGNRIAGNRIAGHPPHGLDASAEAPVPDPGSSERTTTRFHQWRRPNQADSAESGCASSPLVLAGAR
jgi:hypothetical protein